MKVSALNWKEAPSTRSRPVRWSFLFISLRSPSRFATVEIERMCSDPDGLDKAIHVVEQQIQEMNKKQKAGIRKCAFPNDLATCVRLQV